nr:UDP-glycosyltransferase 90A1-like [Tanacetum cinerariifolium]
MVTDGFFGWTVESAKKLNIPRLVYYGMSNFVITMSRVISLNKHIFKGSFGNDLFVVPEFPWLTANRADFDDTFTGLNSDGPYVEWVREIDQATSKMRIKIGTGVHSILELKIRTKILMKSRLV